MDQPINTFERIIKEAQVTLATLYRHFPSKVDLAVAYLQGAHDHIVARAMEQAAAWAAVPSSRRNCGSFAAPRIRFTLAATMSSDACAE